ncbi:hypothetical protein [Crocosphaera chwakensis]|uniref:Uncharacterized protein n=1 Tax=Crocosphaera chwakensis CCY0110 TaxID=391612 RepID=A3ITM2_9CHRO|nr:hypothetical protein [Crocosphaera chwakensis]EAZ90203.1 hypothetical protein CY0110_30673 [Crocosphaera chwakensis CCY0110]
MENITIQVDPKIAKAYREADVNKQQTMVHIWNLIIDEMIEDDNFEGIVQEIRQEAKEKGLTSEILEDLLKDE